MLQKSIAVIFVIVGLINFLPIVGAISNAKIMQLYAVNASSPELELLLRHRAILLGIVGAFLIAAAFLPLLQPAGFTIGLVSMISFLVISSQVGSLNLELRRVAVVDWIAVLLLIIALCTWLYSNKLS